MPVKSFLDSNILIYLHSEDDGVKRDTAQSVLDDNSCVTSYQAMNEVSNVWFNKLKWDGAKIEEHLDNIESVCDYVLPIQRVTINKALSLKDRYGFSYYDCLMLASALEGDCSVIFTEDMSDGQLIEGALKITNPFK